MALIAVLEALDPPQLEGSNRRQLICIANTHIHANPELNDVKLWQVEQAQIFLPSCNIIRIIELFASRSVSISAWRVMQCVQACAALKTQWQLVCIVQGQAVHRIDTANTMQEVLTSGCYSGAHVAEGPGEDSSQC